MKYSPAHPLTALVCMMVIQICGCARSSTPSLYGELSGVNDKVARSQSLEKRIASAAHAQNTPVLLEFSGQCSGGVPVLDIKVTTPIPPEGNGVNTLMSMVSLDRRFHVASPNGSITEIYSDRNERSLLDTKISRLSLSAQERFDPDGILSAAVRSSEIVDKLHTSSTSIVIHEGGLVPLPSDSLPSLQGDLSGLTLRQIIEGVLTKFGGAVIVGTCEAGPHEKRLEIRYR